jgi:TolB-like protein/tRNA A-37 threonylcarbamoyl transferase component Bud32
VTPDRWHTVKEALASVLAFPSHEREAHLRVLRTEDAELAREVESLLAHDTEEAFLEQPALPPPPGPLGTVFGPYRVQSTLGAGGMGVVYLARDAILDRPVALKFLSSDLEQQDEARRRFLREAKAAAALDHPYICKIYQTGEHDGRPFIAMEYVRGETLRHRLDTGPLPLKDALWITQEVTEALETAHAAQIVHRDLKPSNIMLTTDGHVKVLDFGLAKRGDAGAGDYARTASALTETGTVRGTVAYMSPEQVRGEDVDSRSDLFSLGVVLYECLSGRSPFVAGSALETASQVLHHTPPPLRSARPEIPPALDHIAQCLLTKAAYERCPSAADLRRDLGRVRELVERGHGAVDLPALDPGTAVVRPVFGRRALLASLATAALLAAGVAWWWQDRGSATAPGGPLSVAVLPFANLGGDAESDHLAAGIPRALAARLQRAGLRVIPWETSSRFRDPSNPKDIARTLQVSTLLTGGFEHTSQGGLKVHASLVDATGFLAWSDDIDSAAGDLFEIQTRIASGVATTLLHELTGEAAIVLAQPESSSEEAYDLYLQGADYLNDADEEGTGLAFDYFSHALELDADLVEAHVGIGAVHLERYWSGWGGGAGNLVEAARSFDAALKRDPKDMRAARGRMLIEFYRGHGEEALRLAQETARTGGGDIEALLARAEAYAINGPSDLAGPLLDRVLTLDPGNQAAAWLRTIASFRIDRFKETAAAADDYLRRFGDDSFIAVLGADGLERIGDADGARERYDHIVERLMRPTIEPGTTTSYDMLALLAAGVFHGGQGAPDRAQALWRRGLQLTRAALTRDANSAGMQIFLATFLGCLGDRVAFLTETERALELLGPENPNPWELSYLTAGYAQLGDVDGAIRVLRRVLGQGRLTGGAWMTVVAPSLRGSPALNEVLREHDAENDRRRRRYGVS